MKFRFSLRSFQRIKLLLLASAFAALGACSQIQLGYNNALPVLRWFLSDYVSLRNDQTADFNLRLNRFYLWHRQNELPEYAKLARLASERIGRGLQAEDVTLAYTLVRERYRVLINRAVDEAAPVLANFDAAQIAQLENSFAESNRKFQKEHLDEDAEERLERRIERLQDNYQDWLGSLNAAQKQRIAVAAKALTDTTEFQFTERQRNQQIFLGLLRARASASEIAIRIKALLADPDAAREPAYRAVVVANEKQTVELLLSLNQLVTPAQRTHVVARFDGYAADFAQLSKVAMKN